MRTMYALLSAGLLEQPWAAGASPCFFKGPSRKVELRMEIFQSQGDSTKAELV